MRSPLHQSSEHAMLWWRRPNEAPSSFMRILSADAKLHKRSHGEASPSRVLSASRRTSSAIESMRKCENKPIPARSFAPPPRAILPKRSQNHQQRRGFLPEGVEFAAPSPESQSAETNPLRASRAVVRNASRRTSNGNNVESSELQKQTHCGHRDGRRFCQTKPNDRGKPKAFLARW